MKKFTLPVALVALLCFGCTKSDYDPSPQKNPDQPVRQASIDQVRVMAGSITNNIFGQDESEGKVRSASYAATRSTENIRVVLSATGDTVMYVINFGNDLGFLLLSADKCDFPILAFNDRGSFDPGQLVAENPAYAWVGDHAAKIEYALSLPADTASMYYKMWESSRDGQYGVEIRPVTAAVADGDQAALTPQTRGRTYSSGRAMIWPVTGSSYRWSQKHPYNYNAPYLTTSDGSGKAKVGCGPLAMAMVCQHHKWPAIVDYSQVVSRIVRDEESETSKLLRAVADSIPVDPNDRFNPDKYYGSNGGPNHIQWGLEGTSVTNYAISLGMMKLGYGYQDMRYYSFDRVYNSLRDGCPVILMADTGTTPNVGHIWFCDGYKELSWEVVSGRNRWYEYGDYLYMSWGWGDSGDGWYEQSNWKVDNSLTGPEYIGKEKNPYYVPAFNFVYNKVAFTNLKPIR